MAKRRPSTPKPVARIVRRTDVNGRAYYIHKDTGKQKSRTAYERDLQRRRTTRREPPPLAPTPRKERRAPVPAQVQHDPAPTPPGGGGGGGGGGGPSGDEPPELGHLPDERPFPPGVSDEGVPEGLFDDAGDVPWTEVDDEADYEEGSGA